MTLHGSGFAPQALTFCDQTHDVYVAGSGPPVVVMHEVPGLHPGVVRFGRALVDAGFAVWMPSLFGTPGKQVGPGYMGRQIARACVSREFATWALRRTSPKTLWLRALARHAHEASGGLPVGAIGMCLTGGFALAMAVDPELRAPVLSQPSLPFAVSPLHARDLGVSDADLAAVRTRCVDDGLCVLGLRFSGDLMAPGARFRRLRKELGDAFLSVEIDSSFGNPHGVSPIAHSVLGVDYVGRPGHPTVEAEQRVVDFFRERLQP